VFFVLEEEEEEEDDKESLFLRILLNRLKDSRRVGG